MSDEWPLVSLLELTRPDGLLTDGDWVESKDQDPSGTNRLIQLADVGDGLFLNRSSRHLNNEQFNRLQCTALEPNDVLVSRMADPLGRACLFPGLPQRSATVVDVAIIRPSSAKADPRWLTYAINAPATRAAIQAEASGTTRARVSRSRLAEIEVPTPPLHEQRRIVAKLDALRARSRRAKEALGAVPALLDRLRQSILAAAFRGDLTADWREANPDVEPASELLKRIRIERRKRWEEAELAKLVAKGKPPKDDRWKSKYVEPEPVDESELPELPEGWCWASVDELCTSSDIGLVRSATEQHLDVGTPYVRMQHFDALGRWQLDHISRVPTTPEELEQYTLREGDILFNTRNSAELVGKTAVWQGPPGYVYNNNLMRLRTVPAVSGTWLGRQMAAPGFRARLGSAISATTSIAAIYGRDLFRQPVAVAPTDEQIRAMRTVDLALKRQISTEHDLRELVRTASRIDSAILAAAFRGDLLGDDKAGRAR